MKTSIYLWILLSVATYSASTFAKETVDEHNLLTSCLTLTTREPSSACVYYIQGFLAGALVTDIIRVPKEKDDEGYSFMERASRTRIGKNLNPKHAKRFNRFCIPDDESLVQVLNTLEKPLSTELETVEVLKGRVFQALNEAYPCGRIYHSR